MDSDLGSDSDSDAGSDSDSDANESSDEVYYEDSDNNFDTTGEDSDNDLNVQDHCLSQSSDSLQHNSKRRRMNTSDDISIYEQQLTYLDLLPFSALNCGIWNQTLKNGGPALWALKCEDWTQSLVSTSFQKSKLVRFLTDV